MPPSSNPPRGFNPLTWDLHPITWCVLGMIALVGIGCGCLKVRQKTPPPAVLNDPALDPVNPLADTVPGSTVLPPTNVSPLDQESPAEVHTTTTESYSDSAPDQVPDSAGTIADDNVPPPYVPPAPNIVYLPGPTNFIRLPGKVVTKTVEVEKWRTNHSHSKETVYLPAHARQTTTSSNALANMNGDVHPGAIFAVAGGNVTIGYPPEHMAKLAESALARIPAFKTSAKVQPVMPGQAGVVLEKDQYASIEFPGNIGNFQIMAEETDIETSYDGLTALEAAGRAEGIQGTRRIMIRARKPGTEVAFNW